MDDVKLPPMPPMPHTDLSLVSNFGEDSSGFGEGFTDCDMREYARAYAREAVLAERERCARICREHCEDAFNVPFKNYEDTHYDGYQDAANDIEDAIRNPQPSAENPPPA